MYTDLSGDPGDPLLGWRFTTDLRDGDLGTTDRADRLSRGPAAGLAGAWAMMGTPPTPSAPRVVMSTGTFTGTITRENTLVTSSAQHTMAGSFDRWDGGQACREFYAAANGFCNGLATGGKAVVNSFVSVATLGHVNEAIAVTAEDRANGYDTAAFFGRVGWSALFAAATLGVLDANVCLMNACFAAGTPLLTPDGAKPIEQFKVGDLVLSAPEENPNGPVAARRVEKMFQRLARIVELRVGGQTIRTDPRAPVLRARATVGRKPRLFRPGDLLKSNDGRWVAVESLSDTNEDTTVYNLRIEEYHTYFVGCAEWGFSVSAA